MAEENVSRAEYQQDMEELRREIGKLYEFVQHRAMMEFPHPPTPGGVTRSHVEASPRWQLWLKDYGVLAVVLALGIPAVFYLGGLYRQVQNLEMQTKQLNTTVETLAVKVQHQGEGLTQIGGKLDMLVDVMKQQRRSGTP
jgi:uncharacterized coiled-coil protein SlyX